MPLHPGRIDKVTRRTCRSSHSSRLAEVRPRFSRATLLSEPSTWRPAAQKRRSHRHQRVPLRSAFASTPNANRPGYSGGIGAEKRLLQPASPDQQSNRRKKNHKFQPPIAGLVPPPRRIPLTTENVFQSLGTRPWMSQAQVEFQGQDRRDDPAPQ